VQRLSLRLPLPMAARLAALHELHRGKTLNTLTVDLLRLALEQVDASTARAESTPALPLHAGTPPVYLVSGAFPEFHHLVLKHHRRLERERGGVPAEREPTDSGSGYDLVDD